MIIATKSELLALRIALCNARLTERQIRIVRNAVNGGSAEQARPITLWLRALPREER